MVVLPFCAMFLVVPKGFVYAIAADIYAIAADIYAYRLAFCSTLPCV